MVVVVVVVGVLGSSKKLNPLFEFRAGGRQALGERQIQVDEQRSLLVAPMFAPTSTSETRAGRRFGSCAAAWLQASGLPAVKEMNNQF